MLSLPILSNPARGPADPVSETERAQIAADLEKLVSGQVRFSRHDRMLYATDASNYQIEPIGVVVPDSVESMTRVLAYCATHRLPLLPRGGGTSLPGQCTNRAIVLDHSAFCRRVLSLDRANRLVHVEPGLTVDELNRHLEAQATGLFFAPDPATSAQASLGGCIGNNAAGARSLRYGRTAENVAALDVLLTTGQRLWLERGAGRHSPTALHLAQRVADLVCQYSTHIRQRYPKTSRRNAGYALDTILAQLDQGLLPQDLDLTGLICGSEGTLAVVLGARLKLHPIPQSKGLAIVSFASVEDAVRAVSLCVQSGACAVELIDDVVLDAARGNAECRRYMDLLPSVDGREAQSVLYVEYHESGPIELIHARFAALQQILPDAPLRTYTDRASLARAWALRKAGEPLLHGMASHRKPTTFVEDNAVPLENLPTFVRRFKEIVAKHGTRAAYYAHASVGVLHVRPMLDLHDPADRDRLRAIAVEVADLARQCGGVMSGEHGDGRLRGPLLERFYGPELMEAFAQLKDIFDPLGILNPGIIASPGPVQSITQSMRINPLGPDLLWPRAETYFDYSDQEGFTGALEMCSGAGVCRKTAGGTMCPSYRATLDERHSTRGRANALRLAISGQLPANSSAQPAWDDPETLETLRLCLSCKACKSECPSNVDVARLKAEYTAQRYKHTGAIPLQARVFGHIRLLNRLGSLAPNLANFFTSLAPLRSVMNELLNLAPQRSLPAFAPSLYHWFKNRTPSLSQPEGRGVLSPSPSQGEGRGEGQTHRPPHPSHTPVAPTEAPPRLVLFADCFTTYNEPHIGQAAITLLESLGYRVELPKVGCCGRAMISTGLLEEAIQTIDATLAQLRPFIEDPRIQAILVCEPSCLASMKDEWLQLKLKTDLPLRKQLADKAMLVEEFVERFWTTHPIPPTLRPELANTQVLLHGHCHQKALWGEETSAAPLRRILGQRLKVLPSGCCGMAGSFGYTKDRYEISMKIGQQSLFGLLNSAPPTALVVAPGTSCRHQIKDGTGRKAEHPVELLARLLVS